MYDAPPHTNPNASQFRAEPRDTTENVTPTVRNHLAPIPGRMHPDATGMAQSRDAYIAALAALPEDHVRFGTLRGQDFGEDNQSQQDADYLL